MTPETLNSECILNLWTAHLGHANLEHLLGNALALVLPFFILDPSRNIRLWLLLAIFAPVQSMVICCLDGTPHTGLSALAAMAWAYTALQLLTTHTRGALGLCLLGFISLKLGVESMTQLGLISHTGRWQNLVWAHWIGFLSGAAAAFLDKPLAKSIQATFEFMKRQVTVGR